MRTLAIIPARGGSKRIPRKNIRNFLGKPILSYPISTAIQANIFDEIMVSTDDEEIADVAQFYGANVPFFRSEENASDYATTVDAIIEVLEEYKKQGITFTYACCIYPTSPLANPLKIRKGYKKLRQGKYDTVISVARFSYPIQRSLSLDEKGKLSMTMPEYLETRSQDLPERYHDAGQFYWFNVKQLLEKKTLFTKNTGSILLPENEVQDIDNPSDWNMAELKYKFKHQYYENEGLFQGGRHQI